MAKKKAPEPTSIIQDLPTVIEQEKNNPKGVCSRSLYSKNVTFYMVTITSNS